jgi:DNA-binding response OmpR family regulator
MTSLTLDRATCVLLVEADEVLARHASLDLTESGYTTAIARDTNSGWHQFGELQPALVVMARKLAGESGLHLCRDIRQAGSRIPVLMLLNEETVEDRVACLDAGADDYFLKPYRQREFLDFVGLYLQPRRENPHQLAYSDLVLDLNTRQVWRGERAIELTVKEFELLKYLMEHPGQVLSREQILENVWGYDFMGKSNAIEVYIRYLRLKIEDEDCKRLIQTVRGVGYVLRET